MAIKDTLTVSQAASIIREMYDGTAFSYHGAYALAEWLEDYSESVGEDVELDPIALACEFAEYPSLLDWAEEYWGEDRDEWDVGYVSDTDDEEELEDAIRAHIQDWGMLIEFSGGVLVSSF